MKAIILKAYPKPPDEKIIEEMVDNEGIVWVRVWREFMPGVEQLQWINLKDCPCCLDNEETDPQMVKALWEQYNEPEDMHQRDCNPPL